MVRLSANIIKAIHVSKFQVALMCLSPFPKKCLNRLLSVKEPRKEPLKILWNFVKVNRDLYWSCCGMRTWIITHISTIHCVQVCQLGSHGTWGQQLGVKYSQLASLNCTMDIGKCSIGDSARGKSQVAAKYCDRHPSMVWKSAQFCQNNGGLK